MNQTSKSPSATKVGTYLFSFKYILLQPTIEQVFQLSCSVNWNHFSSTKASPLELIPSSSSLSESSSIISSLLLLEGDYFRRLENEVVFREEYYNLFFSRVLVSVVDLDFSVVAVFCSRVELSLFGKVKNFKDEKEIIAIAKTPEHRKNRKVIESLPLDWKIKVHSKPNLHQIG